jgi:hypothetical protein
MRRRGGGSGCCLALTMQYLGRICTPQAEVGRLRPCQGCRISIAGGGWEFFSVTGVPAPSPYTIDGAPSCPMCHPDAPLLPGTWTPYPHRPPDPDRRGAHHVQP